MQTWCGLHTPPRDYFLEFIILYFTPIRGIKFMFHENKKIFCQLLKKNIFSFSSHRKPITHIISM